MIKKYFFFLVSIIFLFTFTSLANAQRLINALSDRQVSIDSSFDGKTISFFGNIEPNIGSSEKYVDGPFHVITIITGPELDRVVRKKANQIGIWLNQTSQNYDKFPSFYWVLSDSNLENITSAKILEQNSFLPKHQPQKALKLQGEQNYITSEFDQELVRLMEEKGHFGISTNAINFHSDTFYSGSLALPADVPVGYFLTQTYLFKNGEIIFSKAESFTVKKTGFERFLGNFANHSPLLYGIFCVILALFTGWLGGVAFRR